MKLLDILKNKEALFSIDEVEDKKTKVLVKDINTALINLVTEYEDFLEQDLTSLYNSIVKDYDYLTLLQNASLEDVFLELANE